MSWTILIGLVLVLGFLSAVAWLRRAELGSMEQVVEERDLAARQGSREAQLQHPVVDLTRCMGCATCVAVCPEDGVLEIVHGQAMIVNGARCMGIAACERECPVGAVTVTLTNVENRRDIPALDDRLEAVGSPGLFLAGEVTAQALIKTAVEHGAAVGAEVARRTREAALPPTEQVLDLIVVGAGPAGLACALEAKQQGLRFTVIDQETTWGGTVAKYPRRKLVLTQPVDLPLHGRIKQSTFSKEELMELWLGIAAEHQLPLRGGLTFEGVERGDDGLYVVYAGGRTFKARHVCLAIGRRGTPRKLDVPGEELPKVAHSLIDAASFESRKILVVGGGDSAIETALGLATQPGNEVTLSYRKEAFFRLKSRNAQKIGEAARSGELTLLMRSEVEAIHPDRVDLRLEEGPQERCSIANDEVFVMIGGVPPLALLENAGVSFDPSHRPPPRVIEEQGTGLKQALRVAFACAFVVLAFAVWNLDYYFLPLDQRPAHPKHLMLRPGDGLGLAFGIGAIVLVGANLAYLLRRSPRIKVSWGSLERWMTVHVATGIAAVLLALLHAAMQPRDTVGGHSLWMLAGLLVTGAIGRYFYAYVPRAANGRELAIDEIRERAHELPKEWGGTQQAFGEAARAEVLQLIKAKQWNSSFLGRMMALLGDRRSLRRALAKIELAGMRQQVERDEIDETLKLVRRAHDNAVAAAHYEDLRAVAGTWRYLHRWGAVLMVALVALHVAHALIYGNYFGGGK